MKVDIVINAKKSVFKAPINGTIHIDLPMKCIIANTVKEKIISAVKNISIDGVSLAGHIKIDGEIVHL